MLASAATIVQRTNAERDNNNDSNDVVTVEGTRYNDTKRLDDESNKNNIISSICCSTNINSNNSDVRAS